MVDSYTKFVLSIIALCLFMITIKLTVPNAYSLYFGKGEDVIVTNYETNYRVGETLRVHVTNLDELK